MVKTTLALVAILLTGIFAPWLAFAEDEVNVTNALSLEGKPLALRGVDAVALSTLNAVAPGDTSHTVVEDGVAYYFASATSAALFEADPDRYKPQYGGFCAYAVAIGKKLDGDPRYADIVDGKLYLFVSKPVLERYLENPRETLEKADEVWPSIEHKAVGDL